MSNMVDANASNSNKPLPKAKRVIGPRLRLLLIGVLALFTLLSANGIYLFSITWLGHFTGRSYEDFFYQIMFLVHLVLGLIIILPVVVFGIMHMLAARNRRNRRGGANRLRAFRHFDRGVGQWTLADSATRH